MAPLSKRTLLSLKTTYFRRYGFRPFLIDVDGVVTELNDPLAGLVVVQQARARGLQESVQWGEPYIFPIAPGVVSWVVPMVDGLTLRGGIIGGEVVSKDTQSDPTEAIQHFVAAGLSKQAASRFLQKLPYWPETRIPEAVMFLERTFYQMSGWVPRLLGENYSRAVQQRQIAQAIRILKRSRKPVHYPMEKERVLFSLIKDGNRKGARRVLNEILGAIFFRSPKLLTLRGRAIELLGHLARTAITGNPLLESLLEQDARWMEQLVEAPDFEALCMVLNQAIDDFIDQIYLQSRDRSNQKVASILDFINRNYSTKISLPMLAAEAGLSTFRTAHLVKEVTGKTVTQNIQEARINKAKELLQTTAKSCTEIAYEVGYGEQSYFIKHFKRLVGVTPTRYRPR